MENKEKVNSNTLLSHKEVIKKKEEKKRLLSASRLNELLKAYHITQYALAQKLNMSRQNMNHICKGSTVLSGENALKICDIIKEEKGIDINPDWLTGDSNMDTHYWKDLEFQINIRNIDYYQQYLLGYKISYNEQESLFYIEDKYGNIASANKQQMMSYIQHIDNSAKLFFLSLNGEAIDNMF